MISWTLENSCISKVSCFGPAWPRGTHQNPVSRVEHAIEESKGYTGDSNSKFIQKNNRCSCFHFKCKMNLFK